MLRSLFHIIFLLFLAVQAFSQSDDLLLENIGRTAPGLKKGQIDSVKKILADIEERAQGQNNFQLLTKVQIQFLNIGFINGEYNRVIPGINNLLENSKLLSTQDSITIYYYLKKSYVAIKNSTKAFEIHKILAGFERRGLIKDRSLLNPPLSDIYIELGLNEQAVNQLKKEYNERLPLNLILPIDEVHFYNNLGVFMKRWQKYDSAVICFNIAAQKLEKLSRAQPANLDYVFLEGLIGGNKGSVLALQGKFNEAIPLMKKDIFWSVKTGYYESAANAYVSLADAFRKTGDIANARISMDSAFVLYGRAGHPLNEYKAYKTSAEVYESANNYKAAADEYSRYIRIKDSIVNADFQTQIINDQVAFELDEKQNQLNNQKLRIEEGQRALDKNQSDKIILFIAVIAIAAISVILFLANKNSNRKQKELEKKNDEISSKNKVIEQALNDKDALIKEVHHRVKNNLQIISSLLRLQSAKQSDDNVQSMFDESVKRIQSMALVHELLYRNKNFDSIPVHTYIQSLADGLATSYGMGNQVTVTVYCEPAQIDIDTVVPLGLIINELVTNSIKHAFGAGGGKVDIIFEHVNEKYHLIVKDNGKGLPADFEQQKENSLGMELVDALADQINAQYTYKNENGARFEFVF